MLTIFHVPLAGLTDVLWVFIAVPLLGSLILSFFLHSKDFDFAEWLVYCGGVGLAALMISGLILNTWGLAVHHPALVSYIVLPSFDMAFLILMIVGSLFHKNRHLFPRFFPEKANWLLKIRILSPLFIPLLSILGAIRLNNGGTDNIALVALAFIFLCPLYIFIIAKKAAQQELIVNLFAAGLALTLSVSMRSNHIIGSDIHQEYQVFSAVLRYGLWYPHGANLASAYNACLSITILPAVLKALMPISAEYIFKFVMQFIFALMPVVVYVIARQQLSRKLLAYMASFFFIVQSQYIFEFPALIREEVALLFFGLIFVSATSKVLSRFAKSATLLVFGLSMVVSHYSTTYVAIVFLALVVLLRPLLRFALRRMRPVLPKVGTYWYISTAIVLVIVLTAFLWYGETLQATGGVVQKVTYSITNVDAIFNSDSHSGFVNSTFDISKFTYGTDTLEQYGQKNANPNGYDVSPSEYTPFPEAPAGPEIKNSTQSTLVLLEHKLIPLFVGALVGIGALYMLIGVFVGRNNLEGSLIALSSGILFALLAILPNLSQDFGLERLYQQLLVVLSPAFIYGFHLTFKRLRFSRKLLLVGVAITIMGYMAGVSGLIDQGVFGISNINLVNNGTNYDNYYETDGEIDSLLWLQSHHNNQAINFDMESSKYAQAYTTISKYDIQSGLLPQEIGKQSYVYASTTNLQKGLTFIQDSSDVFTFNFPAQFLNNNKNLIYTDTVSEIYK
jgi:uncharacterized membrane protein